MNQVKEYNSYGSKWVLDVQFSLSRENLTNQLCLNKMNFIKRWETINLNFNMDLNYKKETFNSYSCKKLDKGKEEESWSNW